MACSECGKNKKIENKFFDLCKECNNTRLEGRKGGETYTLSRKPRKSLRSKNTKLKTKTTAHKAKREVDIHKNKNYIYISGGRRSGKNFLLDELFYEQCFNQSDHKCEECGKPLPEEFRDSENRIIARYRYSHAIPKSIAPELRHNIKNINHLCLVDHERWENGDRESMKIFQKNQENFPRYL